MMMRAVTWLGAGVLAALWAILGAVTVTGPAQSADAGKNASALIGTTWATQGGRSHVTFELDSKGALTGRFVWLADQKPGAAPLLDTANPDPALRSRPLLGAPFVYGFSQKDGAWVKGRIYNPEDGRTYRSKIERTTSGALSVKGCLGPVCRTQTWMPVLTPKT